MTEMNEHVPLTGREKWTAQSLLPKMTESSISEAVRGLLCSKISVEGIRRIAKTGAHLSNPVARLSEQRDKANAMTPREWRAETFLLQQFPHKVHCFLCGFHADTCVETSGNVPLVGFQPSKQTTNNQAIVCMSKNSLKNFKKNHQKVM